MRIAVVGASGAGILASVFLKRKHPDWKIDVFDRAEKVGKKLLATGNGHCNLLNAQMKGSFYNDPEFVDALLKRYPYPRLRKELEALGVALLDKGDLVYPLSYSAASYVRYLESLGSALGVGFHLGVEVKEYESKADVTLFTSDGPKTFDAVIFATGGQSQKNLGSDGSMFSVLDKHGYDIEPMRPSLCPIKTREKTKMISGFRHEAGIALVRGNQTLYQEVGEILFKDDGLSGIAIFNASAFLARKGIHGEEVIVDFFPKLSKEELRAKMDAAMKANPKNPYAAIIDEKLCEYASFAGKMQGNADLCSVLKGLRFHVDSLYPFASSQVSSGGIKLNQIQSDFSSKREKGIYFIGEMLDVDGLCGGFNLGFALLSGLALSEAL